MVSLLMWGGFIALVLFLLVLDLGVFHRKAHEVSLREAAVWSAVWVALAAAFGVLVHRVLGSEAALQYYTGYLIEKALSVDNIFVFVMLFTHFAVPAKLQHRLLFWGILGAMFMRGAMIAAGAALIGAFHWVIWLFGAFLIWTGAKMLLGRERPVDPHAHPVFRLVRRLVPVTSEYRGQSFLVREPVNGVVRWMATPLLVVLLLVETTDLIFAVDSIPAIFAITGDPFIVFTSNIMAILGLRSLYFLLAGVVPKFRYLRTGLSALLLFVGTKMLIVDLWKVPVALSLGVIAFILAISVIASLLHAQRVTRATHAAAAGDSRRSRAA